MLNNHKTIIHRILTIAVIIVATVITYWLIATTHFEKTMIIHPWWIMGSFIFAIIQKLFFPITIICIFKSIHQKCQYWAMLWITMFSTAANASVPFPAGIPVRLILQQKILDISYSNSTSALAIEMFLSYGSMIVVCMFAFILNIEPILTIHLSSFQSSQMYNFLMIILIIGIVLYIIFRYLGNRWIQSIKQAVRQIVNANPKWIFFSIIIIHISMFISLIRIELLLVSIGCYVSPFSLLVFIIISYLAGVVSFVPMGLGIRDVSFGSLLIFSGISVPSAAAITAIDRIIISVIYLSGSVAATHFIGRQQDR